ncbi:MAG: hypothetical protein AB2A00_20835 [Myxococcota bacterium]
MEAAKAAAQVPSSVKEVLRVLSEAGHHAVVVGGAVRDLVLDLKPGDFDVATSALPEEVMALFPHTVPTGIKHGTVTVVMDEGGKHHPVEVTTFRVEGEYKDGRRPHQVSFVRELREDLSRRDFTVNALALVLWPTPRLEDPFGGLGDLRAGRLRTVGDPMHRFGEDGLRAVRAARFAAQLELTAVAGLEDAMRQTIPIVRKVAPERYLQELKKLFEKARAPSVGLKMLQRTGLLEVVAPGAPGDEASLTRPDRARDPTVRWAAWLWDAGRHGAHATLKALKASNQHQVDVAALCSLPRPATLPHATDAQLRQLLRTVGRARLEWLRELWSLEGGAPLAQRMSDVVARGYVENASELAVDGNQVSAWSDARGKALGELLATLVRRVDENPELNQPEALRALVTELKPS